MIAWDDTLGPWAPPADHYTVDIDGLEVGIGWSYNPSNGQWAPPPLPPEPIVEPTEAPTVV